LKSFIDVPLNANHIFTSNGMGFFMDLGADFGVENNLCNSFPVAQVHENHSAVIPSALDPTHEYHFRTNIICSKFTAGMGFSHISKFV
jgi:hypothetical protein